MSRITERDAEILKPYREQIDALDVEIIDLLVKRFEIVREVGRVKTQENLTIVQSGRVTEVIEKNAKLAAERNFDPDVVRDIYRLLIDYAHRLEDGIKEDLKQA